MLACLLSPGDADIGDGGDGGGDDEDDDAKITKLGSCFLWLKRFACQVSKGDDYEMWPMRLVILRKIKCQTSGGWWQLV